MLGMKMIFSSKNVWSKKMLGPKIFGPKSFISPKKNLVKIFFFGGQWDQFLYQISGLRGRGGC